jgi:hypothetical protein
MAGLFDFHGKSDEEICQQNVSYLIEQGIIDREQGESFIEYLESFTFLPKEMSLVIFKKAYSIPFAYLTPESEKILSDHGVILNDFREQLCPERFSSSVASALKEAVINSCSEFSEFLIEARTMSKFKTKDELIRIYGKVIKPNENLSLIAVEEMLYDLWAATRNEEERNNLMLYAALYFNIIENELQALIPEPERQLVAALPVSPAPKKRIAPMKIAKTKTK